MPIFVLVPSLYINVATILYTNEYQKHSINYYQLQGMLEFNTQCRDLCMPHLPAVTKLDCLPTEARECQHLAQD